MAFYAADDDSFSEMYLFLAALTLWFGVDVLGVNTIFQLLLMGFPIHEIIPSSPVALLACR